MSRLRAALLLLTASTAAAAQYDAPGLPQTGDAGNDGRLTIVRLRWKSDFGGGCGRRGFSAAWNHDYPRAEQHLSMIMKELTSVNMRTDDSVILTLDD